MSSGQVGALKLLISIVHQAKFDEAQEEIITRLSEITHSNKDLIMTVIQCEKDITQMPNVKGFLKKSQKTMLYQIKGAVLQR